MRYLAIVAAGVFIVAAGASANAAPLSPAGMSAAGQSNIIQVQGKKVKPMKRMKRAMNRAKGKMMGWTFTAHCITGTMSCNHGGQSQFEARNACILTHPGCFVSDNK